ncbi:MAG TPA: DHA2 family efflux MFS transporter permease subunit [Thermoleophilaceae bacterium]
MAGEKLRLTRGEARGAQLTVPREALVGRAAEAPWNLEGDDEISRSHARLARTAEGDLVVEDLGSANGTFLNGERIAAPALLSAGDSVRFGTTSLLVEPADAEYLHVSAGRLRGADLPLEGELVFGRAAATQEARLGDDPELSRAHVRLTTDGDGVVSVQDMGSTNGTFVNGERLDGPRRLRPGDQLWIGSTTLELRDRPHPQEHVDTVARPIPVPEEPLPDVVLEPAPVSVSPWVVLLVLALGEFMILIDSTIVNVALPSIATDLGASLDELLWIVNSYVLLFALLLILSGRVGDMIGAKRMFIAGLAVFVLSSAACGVANDPVLLIGFRALEGIGAAMLLPQTLSLITYLFEPETRGKALGIWGGVAGLSIVCGPVVGGLLTTHISWRAIFFLNVPIGIAAMVLAWLLMPVLRVRERHSLDVGGVLLLGVGLAALIFGLIDGERYDWGQIAGPLSIPLILGVAVVSLGLFVIWERRQEEPLVPLKLFHDRNYSIGTISMASINFCVLGLFLTSVVYFQSVHGYSAVTSGLALLPLAGAIMISSPVGGALVDKPRGRYVLTAGLAGVALGFAGTAIWIDPDGKFVSLVAPFVVIGLGMGLGYTSLTALAVRNIAPAESGVASGFIETAGQAGSALGTAIIGAVLQLSLASAQEDEARRLAVKLPASVRDDFIDSYSHGAGSVLSLGAGGGATQPPKGVSASVAHDWTAAGQEVFQHAYVTAMKASLIGPIGVALAAMGISLLIKPPRIRRERGVSDPSLTSFPKG